jgi:hypothetical protein
MSSVTEAPFEATAVQLLAPPSEEIAADNPPRARGGRPLLESRTRVLERIAGLANRAEGLFRTHRTHPSLYARARRLFGTWAAAVAAAGVDYAVMVDHARRRSAQNRRRRRPRPVLAARVRARAV